MGRIQVATHLGVAVVLGCALTLVVLIGSGFGAHLPVAAAAELKAPTAPGDTYCVAVISTTYPGCTRVFTNVQAAVDAKHHLLCHGDQLPHAAVFDDNITQSHRAGGGCGRIKTAPGAF